MGTPDHPRACGENLIILNQNLRRGGSPPRMRGKPSETFADGNTIRITPAHAGKTDKAGYGLAQWTDHPRACGENKNFPLQFLVAVGSPPRMRGKPVALNTSGDAPRITPAHAGKTASINVPEKVSSDHPRACGENRRRKCELGGNSGSPPRMRGKLLSSLMKNHCRRITPAHAGKTSLAYNNLMPCLDHPRACGENGRCWRLLERTGGSPPRMRGKLTSGISGELEPRITPAHAGKTY